MQGLNKATILLGLLVLFLPFVSAIESAMSLEVLKTDDVFVELISNTDQCLINCEAVFTIHNPTSVDFTDFLGTRFEGDSWGIKEHSFEIETTQLTDHTNPIQECIIENVTLVNEKDSKNITVNEVTTCEIIGWDNYTSSQTVWVPYDNKSTVFEKSKDLTVKLKGTKDPWATVDWVPEIAFKTDEMVKAISVDNKAWAVWSGDSWTYCQPITLTSEDALAGYAKLANVSYDAHIQNDFDDIRFTTGTCSNAVNELYFDLDEKSNGIYATYWVNTTLSAGQTQIAMFYGNAGATSGENEAETWKGAYLVYHFNETSGTTIYDHAGGGYDATFTTSGAATLDYAGKVGSGIRIVPNSYVMLPNPSGWDTDSQSSIEYSVYYTSAFVTNNPTDTFFVKETAGSENDMISLSSVADGNHDAQGKDSAVQVWQRGDMAYPSQWYNRFSWANASGNNFYVNGISQTLTLGSAASTFWIDGLDERIASINNLEWGGTYYRRSDFVMDEFRYWKDPKSAMWANYSYWETNNLDATVTFGAEEVVDTIITKATWANSSVTPASPQDVNTPVWFNTTYQYYQSDNVTTSTFNDSSSSATVTSNGTIWIDLPSYAVVEHAQVDVTGLGGDYTENITIFSGDSSNSSNQYKGKTREILRQIGFTNTHDISGSNQPTVYNAEAAGGADLFTNGFFFGGGAPNGTWLHTDQIPFWVIGENSESFMSDTIGFSSYTQHVEVRQTIQGQYAPYTTSTVTVMRDGDDRVRESSASGVPSGCDQYYSKPSSLYNGHYCNASTGVRGRVIYSWFPTNTNFNSAYDITAEGLVLVNKEICFLLTGTWSTACGTSAYPSYVNVDVSDSGNKKVDDWATMDNTTTLTNFATEMNTYLSDCTADASGRCQVPITVNATTFERGITFDSLNVTWFSRDRTYETDFNNTVNYVSANFTSAGDDISNGIKLPKNAHVESTQMYLSGSDAPSPSEVLVDVSANGDYEYTGSGDLVANDNETVGNFTDEINDYLNTCTEDANGNCTIPVLVHSDTAGGVTLHTLSIEYYSPIEDVTGASIEVFINIDDVNYTASYNSNTGTYDLANSTMTVGNHTWYGVATDTSGNYENHTLTSQTYTIEAGVTEFLSFWDGLLLMLTSSQSKMDLTNNLLITSRGGRMT